MKLRFGEFVLDSSTGSLTGPEGPVSLRRQTFRLLEVLLEHAPNLVDHDTLLDEAWGRTALSPNVLPQAISELRQALGDSASDPQYIETLHRRGYRIIPEVERVENSSLSEEDTGLQTGAMPTRRSTAWIWIAPMALAVGLIAAWWMHESDERWLEKEALPRIEELRDTDVAAAWQLAFEARQRVDDNARLEQLWLDLTVPVTLKSEPTGAKVKVAGYGAGDDSWTELGTTPIEDIRMPLAPLQFRVSKPGFETIEVAPSILPKAEAFRLHPEDAAPEGMVYVPAGSMRYRYDVRELPEFWIDRHEITNEQFREFVIDGGYENPDLWPEQIEQDGEILTREALLARFVDETGMRGPSTWSLGTFAEGEDQYPLEGISWYEASAYAKWAGKQLPTVYHWYRAAGLGTQQVALFSDILSYSNFSQDGAVPVGSLGGLGPYGTYDMPGNVKEWCRNTAGDYRYAMGATWHDNSYQFSDWLAFDPLRRDSGFGMRLIWQEQPVAQELLDDHQSRVDVRTEPVDDATFEIYSRLYDYDPTPLNAEVVEIDDSHSDWRRELVAIDAAYGGERFTIQIIIPREAEPPYQSVLHLPGGDALLLGDSRKASLIHVEPFLRTGRVVVYPIINGTFERSTTGLSSTGPMRVRDLLIQQVKDVRRTLDYLETRPEFNMDAVAFHGISYGASRSMFSLAVDDRFDLAMLISTGLSPTSHLPPEVQQVDYLHQIEIPVLLITGKNDFTFPYETAQKPLFRMLGTPDDAKRHVAPDWGHLPPGYSRISREVIDWMDRWLGPADRS